MRFFVAMFMFLMVWANIFMFLTIPVMALKALFITSAIFITIVSFSAILGDDLQRIVRKK